MAVRDNIIYSFQDNSDDKRALHLQTKNKEYSKDYLYYNNKYQDNLPIEFVHLTGSKPFDLISCGFASVYLISDQLFQLLKDNEIKGWEAYDVIAYDKGKNPLNGYRGLSITGKCGPIKSELSEKKLMPPRVPWADPYEAHIGLYFDPDSWDGNDMFSPEGSYYIFVTEKVKQLCESVNLTNVFFYPLSEIENIDAKVKS